MTDEPAITVRGLGKSYGPHRVVHDLDLDVHRGEIVALLGPNGAGKTTTVEILTGHRSRSEGTASVLGTDPGRGGRAWRARIGVVPQTTSAFEDLTLREVVGHFATFYPTPMRADEAIELVGLSDRRDARCATLSGGQQRRLDVALGIVGNPELIFLDEPTTGLDPVARRGAWELVRLLAGRGVTTVLTTHYLDEAEALAQRAGILVGGTLVEFGPLDRLGGRARSGAAIRFTRTGGLIARPLPELPAGTEIVSGAQRVEIRTERPAETVTALLAWARDGGVPEPDGLEVRRSTLEDVYLDLIRRHEGDTAPGPTDAAAVPTDAADEEAA